MGVVESVYHQGAGEEPTAVESRFFRLLQTDEDPYLRRTKVGEDWKAVSCDWVDRPSVLTLSNEEGRGLQVQPTPEQAAATAAKVILVGVEVEGVGVSLVLPFARIEPGESCRFCPADVGRLRLRSLSGEARYSLGAFPR